MTDEAKILPFGNRAMSAKQRGQHLARQQRLDRERTEKPIPDRITAALDIRGLYGPEVDLACGVEEPAVDLWEAGELVPTAEQVEALARLTGFPVRFFYTPSTVKVDRLFICRTDGCELVDTRPDADIQPFTGQGRLL